MDPLAPSGTRAPVNVGILNSEPIPFLAEAVRRAAAVAARDRDLDDTNDGESTLSNLAHQF